MRILNILNASKATMNVNEQANSQVTNKPSANAKAKLSAAVLKEDAVVVVPITEPKREETPTSTLPVIIPKAKPAKAAAPKKAKTVKEKTAKAAEPIKEQPKEQPSEAVLQEKLYIHEYSAKSFAVFGNTKPIKEQLKKAGGRFNPCLHPFGAECSVPGWIFPIKARPEVEKLIK